MPLDIEKIRERAGRSAMKTVKHSLPCIALGPVVEKATCVCRRNDSRTCLKGLGVVSQNGRCETCVEYEAGESETDPDILRLPSEALAGRPGAIRFNGGTIRYNGKLHLAYRTGWAGAQCHVSVLRDDWTVERSVTLSRLRHRFANYGREDPRLFIHRGQLHVSYVGVEHGPGIFRTNILYASLRDDLRVDKVYAPVAPDRTNPNRWEKNWSFFSQDDQLYTIYSIRPHIVYRLAGDKVVERIETHNAHPWSGGYLRGGASPVWHEGKWWHWFHGGHDLAGGWPTRRYNVGVYTFNRDFTVTGMTPHPVYTADDTTRPEGQYCSCVFPCGALHEGGRWVVSAGIHDRWIERHTYPPGVPTL